MARTSVLDRDIEKVLISQEEIEKITDRIADEIDRDYKDSKRLLLLCILKGSVVFMGDLMKKVSLPVEIDFMKVSSYGGGTSSSGRINIILDLHRNDLSECDIIVVEDIIDSGKTLSYLTEYLKIGGAKSVKTVGNKNRAAKVTSTSSAKKRNKTRESFIFFFFCGFAFGKAAELSFISSVILQSPFRDGYPPTEEFR